MRDNFNSPELWSSDNIDSAFLLVGGPNKQEHINESVVVGKLILSHIPNNSTCLEIGCGFGRMLKSISDLSVELNKNITLYGVDFNKKMVELSRNYINDNKTKVSHCVGSKTTFLGGFFDFIYTHAVMIHNSDESVFNIMKECKRLVKKGGLVWHDFLNGNSEEGRRQSSEALSSKFPLYSYGEGEIKRIAELAGLKIIEKIDGGAKGERRWYLFKNE